MPPGYELSPTQPATLYLGSQFLFRSRDKGFTWQRISPDLTTNDPAKQKQEQSGGITVDNSSAEMHTTIYSISESPKNAGVIWVGTDDGNLQLTRDAGRTWKNLVANVPGLPPNSWVSWVEASRFDAATAYATFDRHTFGDMTPWAFVTHDYGATWQRIASPDKGIRGYAHTIKEDTIKKNLLFLGTELGLWISVDAGATWARFEGGNFPSVAVREVQVQPRDGDLVIATHGRGIWIIDDLTPLRALSDAVVQKQTAFLPIRGVQQRMPASGGWVEGDATFVGDNAPNGLVVTYYLRTRHTYGPIKLEVLDPHNKHVAWLSPSKHRGINRVVWNMRVDGPRVPRAAQVAFGSSQGPRVVPGTYTFRLTRGSEAIDTKVAIGLDRRAPYNVGDRTAEYNALIKAGAIFNDMSALVDKIDGTREATAERAQGLPATDPLAQKLHAIEGKLDATKKLIVATTEGGAITGELRIREHLDEVYGAIAGWEGRPAPYQLDRLDVLRRELGDAGTQFDTLVAKDIRSLDGELQQHKLAPIAVSAVDRDEDADPVAFECIATMGKKCGDAAAGVATERDNDRD